MEWIERLVLWIREQVESAGSNGAVFGLSGGLDSSVVGALCARALGANALGLIMPCQGSPDDVEDARLVAGTFGITTMTLDLASVYDGFLRVLPDARPEARSNLKPRLRMAALYYVANDRGYLVAGTGNKSEVAVGYFTKYGDGGADILPLADIFKTDLFGIARELGVPEHIVERPPSAGLWEGQTDEGEMGIRYADLDRILKALEVSEEPVAPAEVTEKVRGMVRASEHKRHPPARFDAGDGPARGKGRGEARGY